MFPSSGTPGEGEAGCALAMPVSDILSVVRVEFLTCPRCLKSPLAGRAKFCPRCGLPNVLDAAAEHGPRDIPVAGRVFRVLDRIAAGSISNVYRCRFFDGPREVEAVAKIARDARMNDLLMNEAAVLRRLHAADPANRCTPALPWPEVTFAVNDGPGVLPRQASVLRMHPDIRSPDELYSLDDVRALVPTGLDPRHVAWIWRQLLSVLGFAHSTGTVHGAVLPPHVLIEPRLQKLLLIDWCCAIPAGSGQALRIISGPHLAWYQREHLSSRSPTPAIDVALAARSMIFLLGGDPVTGMIPPTVDPALQRHFARCISRGPNPSLEPWRLLEDVEKVIATLWGPRQFVPLVLPPK